MTADPLTHAIPGDWPCGRCTHLYSAHDTQGCHPIPGRHECNCRYYTLADSKAVGEPDDARPRASLPGHTPTTLPTTTPLAYLHATHAAAQADAEAATAGPWWYNPGKQWLDPDAFERYDLTRGEEFVGYGGPSPFVGAVAATGPANNPQSMADAAFIARHDPAAVLRRIAGDRKLLERHRAIDCKEFGCDCHTCCATCRWTEADERGTPEVWGEPTRHVHPCPTIRDIAEGWGWTEGQT